MNRPYSLGQLFGSLFVHVIATFAALVSTFALTKITVLLKLTLIWYSKPILTVFMYGVPAFAVAASVHSFMAARLTLKVKSRANTARNASREATEKASFDAQLIVFGIFLCALTFMKIASAYLLLLFVLFPLARDAFFSIVGKVTGSQGKRTNKEFNCIFILDFRESLYTFLRSFVDNGSGIDDVELLGGHRS